MKISITRKDIVLFVISISALYLSTAVDRFSTANMIFIYLAAISGGILILKFIFQLFRLLFTELNKRFSTSLIVNRLLLLLEVLWTLLFIYLGYVSYDVAGEEALGFFVLILYLTFPSSVLLVVVLRAINSIASFPHLPNYIENLISLLCFFMLGYIQWFILLPWLIRKISNYGKKEIV